jgi:hypothetical protein
MACSLLDSLLGRGLFSATGGGGSASVAEEFQRLRHEQVVVLEDAAVAGVWVDAELGVGSNWARWSELLVGSIVSSSPLTARTGVRRVVGKQIRVNSQLDTDGCEFCLDLSQVALDQRTGDRVDGKPAVLVGRVGLEPATGGL